MKIRNEILLPVFVTALALSGCEKPETPAPDPELNIVSETVQAVYEGGEYEIAYTLDNPVEGCEIEPVPEVDWIGGFDFSQEGKIAFLIHSQVGEVRIIIPVPFVIGTERLVCIKNVIVRTTFLGYIYPSPLEKAVTVIIIQNERTQSLLF